ncbi:MAG TPA: hypothetical protein VFH58_12635 [Acidimicrobiales bacterium]|nr:hypothetical protein [Acidimicrobiales bacterium]
MTRAGSQVRWTSPGRGTHLLGRDPDFACGYAVAIAAGDGRSTEHWARAAWEGAPTALRWFMLAGWRFVLGLHLGPRGSSEHILGWQIVENRPDETVCRLRSGFLTAYNTFRRVDERLVWSTFVAYERPIAKFIWPPVSLLHRPLVRIALRRAARQVSN